MILTIKSAANLSRKLKKQGKSIVLAGGCFDVIHPGHIIFLQKAKKAGDALILMLESDGKVRSLKGDNRPVHTQKERAQVLSAIIYVDHIVMLPFITTALEYDKVIEKIRPDVIAAANGDINTSQYLRAAKKVEARFKYVTKVVGNYSTSLILSHKR